MQSSEPDSAAVAQTPLGRDAPMERPNDAASPHEAIRMPGRLAYQAGDETGGAIVEVVNDT